MSDTTDQDSRDDETVRNNPAPSGGGEDALVISLLNEAEVRREWRFASDESVLIGRGADANVQIDDPALSRRHATIEHGDRGWTYRHVGANDSLLDGAPIIETRLIPGTVIRLRARGPRLRFDPRPSLGRPGSSEGDHQSSKPITVWVQELADGNSEAATHLWEAYFERIARLAKLKLKPSLRRVSDEEDVAASVFASLCDGILEGRFPELSSRDNLWRLLATMTARKAIDTANHASRKKRGGGQVRGESIFIGADGEFGIEQFLSLAEGPDFETQLVEEVELRLDGLDSDELRQVAQLRLEGYTVQEIAERLGCDPRTVQRRMQAIREKWDASDSAPSND